MTNIQPDPEERLIKLVIGDGALIRLLLWDWCFIMMKQDRRRNNVYTQVTYRARQND
jgi:hypothetical protein